MTILDNDRPGIIGFKERFITVRRKDEMTLVVLERTDGCDGDISVKINTKVDIPALTGKEAALPGQDFVEIKDREVEFKSNVTSVSIEVHMPDIENVTKAGEEKDVVSFAIEISDPKPDGVRMSKKNLCFIDILPDSAQDEERELFEKQEMLKYFVQTKEMTYGQQFKAACMLGPSIDDDNHLTEVECGEAIMHFFAMPWKVIFALVPPRHIWGGWLAFCVALALIGAITAIVGELANMLGCVVGLKTSVTGITLVALGTSLPDTFASRTAAINSKYADSAVGNVTGSNSVNVFLGLGLPWTIAASYWHKVHQSSYFVPSGSLGFSVVMFTSTSLICFLILGLRRCYVGGELGGPGAQRPVTALILVLLWIAYVTACTLQAYGVITVDLSFKSEDAPAPS